MTKEQADRLGAKVALLADARMLEEEARVHLEKAKRSYADAQAASVDMAGEVGAYIREVTNGHVSVNV